MPDVRKGDDVMLEVVALDRRRPKYVVSKCETGEVLESDSYFVIRQQDVFGAAALYGYAHLCQTGLELARQRGGFTDEECSRLESQAEELSELAFQWQQRGGTKVPD